ncbi:DNA-binding transcriptional regulator, GntR family [Pedococcus dokdonensis]|uniref:DNA-binding transcriptional regulator, GntR family n=1 Tax=Pedococcus dokdonensis TaxID=443156 RepID=A0A1H0T947_9MICO|nr:GntR family transcriptional regulator [Pedococcus dokdonensis]SDP50529.1 DNA-binding transcriptional regulator, GntR family [Pedococcus dokdonensis]
MVDRPRRASGGQLVYTELRRQILDLELAPGQRLFEPELATRLQVSRTPLREALRLLLAEDLLDQLPTGGMVVRPLSAREIEELYTVRASLEGLLTAEAARRVDDAGLATLRGLVERNAALVDLPTDAMNAGHEFHLAIGELAGHEWASRLHAQVDGQMARYRAFTNQTQERRTLALAEHRQILKAIEARDPDRARTLAERHVLAARDTALAAIGDRLDPPG